MPVDPLETMQCEYRGGPLDGQIEELHPDVVFDAELRKTHVFVHQERNTLHVYAIDDDVKIPGARWGISYQGTREEWMKKQQKEEA